MNFEKQKMINSECGFSCDLRTVKAFPLHGHDYYEMELTVEGQSTALVNKKQISLCRGTLCFMAPGDIHAITGKEEIVTFNLSFDERLWDPPIKIKLPYICELKEESVFLVEELYSLLAKSKDAFSGRTLANAIISLCTKDASLENCDDAVAKAKEYITRHFRENPGLKLCAEFVGLSPNYLAFCFKRQYGLSFKQYLTKCKLSCAKAFLENGASVTKACFDSGFESLSAFYTAFKNQNGLAPSKWKK